KGNAFCVPLTSYNIERAHLHRSNLSKDTWKYAAINLYHLRDYGTLEFRHHPGTRDVKAILGWIRTIEDIYNFAKKTKHTDMMDILMDLNTSSGYVEFVRAGLPHWEFPIEADQMYDSVTAAKFFLSSKDK